MCIYIHMYIIYNHLYNYVYIYIYKVVLQKCIVSIQDIASANDAVSLVQRIMPTSGQNNLTYSPRHNTCLLPSSRHWLLRRGRRRSSLSQICTLSLQCTCCVMFLPKSTHQKNWPPQKRTRQMNPIVLLTYTISHRTPLGSPKSATSCLHCRNQAIF